MRNRVLIIGTGCICLMAISSCSMFRSTKYTSQSSSSVVETKTHLTESSVDTGKTTIKESTTEIFNSPGLSASKYFKIPPAALLQNLSTHLYRLDTGLISISVGYDTLTHSMAINLDKKPEAGTKHTEKTTTIQNGETKKKEVKQEKKKKKKAAAATSTKKPDYSWIAWLAGIIGALAILLFLYHKISAGTFLSGLFKRK